MENIEMIKHRSSSIRLLKLQNKRSIYRKTPIVPQTDSFYCKYCNEQCIRRGIANGNQQYSCKSCGKLQKAFYSYNASKVSNNQITDLLKEGVSQAGIARLLNISENTVSARIRKIAAGLKPNPQYNAGSEYEIDELKTYIKKEQRGMGNLCY